jgi:hypothetical protein
MVPVATVGGNFVVPIGWILLPLPATEIKFNIFRGFTNINNSGEDKV